MAYEDKSAYAMCIFSLAIGPNVEPITFVGKTLVSLPKYIHLMNIFLKKNTGMQQRSTN